MQSVGAFCSWRQMAFVSSLIDRCGWAADRSVGDFGQALPVGFGTKATHTTNRNASVSSKDTSHGASGFLIVYAYYQTNAFPSGHPTYIFRYCILQSINRSTHQSKNTSGHQMKSHDGLRPICARRTLKAMLCVVWPV